MYFALVSFFNICYITFCTSVVASDVCVCRFCKHSDENKRQKVALILDKLITLTIEEVQVTGRMATLLKKPLIYRKIHF